MLNKLMNKRQKKKRKGFTLVELVIVVGVVAILAGIAVTAFTNITEAANQATFEANHRTIVTAVIEEIASNDGQVASPFDADLKAYISNSKGAGVASLKDSPKGSMYTVAVVKDATTGVNRITVTSTYNGKTLTYTS
jgi:type IV pilus assembly protein PilA